MPSKNSKEAPPPVETCVTLSLFPDFAIAEALSPPPTIVVASDFTKEFATSKVPLPVSYTHLTLPTTPYV